MTWKMKPLRTWCATAPSIAASIVGCRKPSRLFVSRSITSLLSSTAVRRLRPTSLSLAWRTTTIRPQPCGHRSPNRQENLAVSSTTPEMVAAFSLGGPRSYWPYTRRTRNHRRPGDELAPPHCPARGAHRGRRIPATGLTAIHYFNCGSLSASALRYSFVGIRNSGATSSPFECLTMARTTSVPMRSGN
jgi:hypothetical protein